MTDDELRERVRGVCSLISCGHCTNHSPCADGCMSGLDPKIWCFCEAILTILREVQREAAHPICEQHNDELTFCVACAAVLKREAEGMTDDELRERMLEAAQLDGHYGMNYRYDNLVALVHDVQREAVERQRRDDAAIIERQGEIIEDLRKQLGLPDSPEASLLEALNETRTESTGATVTQVFDMSAHRDAAEGGS